MSNNVSYNTWLRESNQDLLTTLVNNMVRLQAQLQVLDSLLQWETTTVPLRVSRVNQAVIHLMTEIHLLVTLNQEDL